MTVQREAEGIFLVDVCAIEDAEALLHQVQAGAAFINWSGCTHLHAACLQVILASGIALQGMPNTPALARWVAPLLPSSTTIQNKA